MCVFREKIGYDAYFYMVNMVNVFMELFILRIEYDDAVLCSIKCLKNPWKQYTHITRQPLSDLTLHKLSLPNSTYLCTLRNDYQWKNIQKPRVESILYVESCLCFRGHETVKTLE